MTRMARLERTAEAMAAALVENQSLEFAKLDEQGKTDAVSGVSISVGGFVDLAQQSSNQAAGIEEANRAGNRNFSTGNTGGCSIRRYCFFYSCCNCNQ